MTIAWTIIVLACCPAVVGLYLGMAALFDRMKDDNK